MLLLFWTTNATMLTLCMFIWQGTKPFANRQNLLLIFHFFNPRCSMRMPPGDLPIRCYSCTVCGLGRLNRFSIRFLPLFAFLRLFDLLRLLILLVVCNQFHQTSITIKE